MTLQTNGANNSPNPNQKRPKQRHSPMHTTRILRRPPINKQPSRNKRRAKNQRRQSILRLPLPSILLRQPLQDPIRTISQRSQSHEISNPKPDVRQTDGGLAKPIRLAKHERESREQEVKNAVHDGHVQRHQGADGREQHQLRRPGYGADEDFFRSEVLFEFGAEGRVGSFFAETRGFAGEEDGRVGFVYGEEGGERDDGDGDGEDPEDPAPAGGGGEEAAADGAWEGGVRRLGSINVVVKDSYLEWDRKERPLPRDSWLGLFLLDALDLPRCHWIKISKRNHGRTDDSLLAYPPIVTGATPYNQIVSELISTIPERGLSSHLHSRKWTYPTTSEKPKNNQHLHIRRERASNRKDEISQITSMVDVQSAIKLAERCDQNWTESEAKEIAVRGQHRLTDEYMYKTGRTLRQQTSL